MSFRLALSLVSFLVLSGNGATTPSAALASPQAAARPAASSHLRCKQVLPAPTTNPAPVEVILSEDEILFGGKKAPKSINYENSQFVATPRNPLVAPRYYEGSPFVQNGERILEAYIVDALLFSGKGAQITQRTLRYSDYSITERTFSCVPFKLVPRG